MPRWWNCTRANTTDTCVFAGPPSSLRFLLFFPSTLCSPGGTPITSFNASNPGALLATEPSIKICPYGTWTVELGSQTVAQCCEYHWLCWHAACSVLCSPASLAAAPPTDEFVCVPAPPPVPLSQPQ
jgi:hypothetical protein